MERIILPREDVLQLTRVRSTKQQLQLRLMNPEGLIVKGENRWGNDRGELFVSFVHEQRGTTSVVVACAISEDEIVVRLHIIAQIRLGRKCAKITRITNGAPGFYDAPHPKTTGRGFFGVVLSETVALALDRNISVVKIMPDDKRLRDYYARYGFGESQKGQQLLPIRDFCFGRTHESSSYS
ncbi:MAG: hypothetical protein ABID61_05615 [Candidatus Micrarchaeota archaeon]